MFGCRPVNNDSGPEPDLAFWDKDAETETAAAVFKKFLRSIFRSIPLSPTLSRQGRRIR